MILKQKVLDHAIDHWQNNFTGVSAISISDELSYLHEEILAIFEELSDEGFGTLREDVKLYRLLMPKDKTSWYDDAQEIVTSIFFPSKDILMENFYSSSLGRQKLPEYVIRLHMGYSQIHLCYFALPVLKKYLDHPEIYNVEDTVAGGMLTFNHKDLEQESFENDDEIEGMMFIRYGKRLLANGQVTVTAILHDLSVMPETEQRYWHSFELEKPTFDQNDPDFDTFVRRNFEAEWVDYNDPLGNVIDALNRLNEVLGNDFFTREKNAYLAYPVANTYKNFCDSCSELYKLIGPDSINSKILKSLLMNQLRYTEDDFVHEESGRALSKLQLLKILTQNIRSAKTLLDIINEVKEFRVSADHRIIEPQNTESNFIFEFRRICDDFSLALDEFTNEINHLLNE